MAATRNATSRTASAATRSPKSGRNGRGPVASSDYQTTNGTRPTNSTAKRTGPAKAAQPSASGPAEAAAPTARQTVTESAQKVGGLRGPDWVNSGAGFLLGMVLYALALNYVQGGPAQAKGWLAAKFLNKPYGHTKAQR